MKETHQQRLSYQNKPGSRIVVKVGTSTLILKGKGLDEEYLHLLAEQIAQLRRMDLEVVLVSSGAIGAGLDLLGKKARPRAMAQNQAAAAIGQCQLMHLYSQALAKHGLLSAQLLLTREDLTERNRYVNAKNTFAQLFAYGVVPIVNENDTVSVEEITFGDNDRLAAMVASLVDAKLLVLLTDVEGILRSGDEGKPILIDCLDVGAEQDKLAAGNDSGLGVGGVKSKLIAAGIAARCGIDTVIAHGRRAGVLQEIIAGRQVGTFIPARRLPLQGKKKWIASGLEPKGKIVVNEGAKIRILNDGKSLLPVGVLRCEGPFQAGDTVALLDGTGNEFARGIAQYGRAELEEIKGLKLNEIESKSGASHHKEVIHRDNLVVEV